MLSVVAWDGEAGNGLWHDPVNWRDELGSDVLPGPGDDVVIDVPGDITVNLSSGDHSINSLNSQETLNISGGSLDIAAASQINSLTLSGTLSGTGDLTVTDRMHWQRGTMAGPGSTNILSGAVLDISCPGHIPVKTLDGRTLNNWGTATLSTGDGQIYLKDGAEFNNLAGGVFHAENVSGHRTHFFGVGSLPTAFNNEGTFIKSVATNLVFDPVSFNNSGTVEVREGALKLNGGGTSDGRFVVEPGANLTFGGTYVLAKSQIV